MPPPLVDSGTDEWQIGLELESSLGFRQANAAVRNSELELSREKAVLDQLERQIVHDLSNAVAEQRRVFQLVMTTFNRRAHAQQQFDLLSNPDYINTGRADYSLMLDATRRLAEADSAYQSALVNYAVSLKNVHLEQGNLMDYCNVHFAAESLMHQ
jgi:outer membrane protein TolC